MLSEHAYDTGTEQRPVIEHYEAIAAASRRMLDAARAADWDEVGREEERCRVLIGRLKRAQPDGGVDSGVRRVRFALLRAILADDAEIRELSEPWLKQLEVLLGGCSAGQRR
jgi:flagellar protein FliT